MRNVWERQFNYEDCLKLILRKEKKDMKFLERLKSIVAERYEAAQERKIEKIKRDLCRRGFMSYETQKEVKERCKKFEGVRLAEILYHPAVTEEDCKKVEAVLDEIEEKCNKYFEAIKKTSYKRL